MKITYRVITIILLLAFCLPLCNVFADTKANKASKTKTLTLRDPFWPIGFVPVSADKDLQDKIIIANPINWPKLKILGISKSNKGYMALIKDIGTVKKGRILNIKQGRRNYQIRIDSITSKGIKTTNLKTTPIGKKTTNKSKKTKGAR